MATPVRPIASVTVDNPHALGLITKFGHGQDWRFDTPASETAVAENYVKFSNHDRTTWVESIGCVKAAVCYDKNDWMRFQSGGSALGWMMEDSYYNGVREEPLWRVARPSIETMRMMWFDYYESNSNKYGTIVRHAAAPLSPNIHLWIAPMSPVEQQDDMGMTLPGSPDIAIGTCMVRIEFLGDGAQPGCYQYAMTIPLQPSASDSTTAHYTCPWFQTRPYDTPGASWTTAALWDAGAFNTSQVPQNLSDLNVQCLTFETLDDLLLVRARGVGKDFIWKHPGNGSQRGWFRRGPVRIIVSGQPAMIWCSEILYGPRSGAATASVAPVQYSVVNGNVYNTTRTPHWHGYDPTHPYLPAATEVPIDGLVWDVAATEETVVEGATTYHRPRLSMSLRNPITGEVSGTTDLTSKVTPAVWCTTLHAPALQGSAVTAPVTLAGPTKVQSVRYRLCWAGKNQWAQITVKDKGCVQTWRGNEQVVASVGWEEDDGTPHLTQKFAGYVGKDGIDYRYDAARYGYNNRLIDLSCSDPIDARLSKKYMQNTSVAAGHQLALWVQETLWDAGVPTGQLTNINALVSDPTVPTIPVGPLAGELRGNFGANTCRIDAIDEIVYGLGWEWGWDCTIGQYFLRRPVTYTSSVATIADGAEIREVKFSQGTAEYRNYMLMLGDMGGGWTQWLMADTAAHRTITDHAFIGDDWWEIVTLPESEGPAAAYRRWQELQRKAGCIEWTQSGVQSDVLDSLHPGDFVTWNETKHNVPSGSVFLIEEEEGAVDCEEYTWTSTYRARLWHP
jgi:hypothetical protein